MNTLDPKEIREGDDVYVIYRNPHAATVANIQKAEIVQHPENKNDVALFIHESYHLIGEDDALFPTEQDAQQAYNEIFDYEQYD
ncbi:MULTISPECIES: transcriptional regulator SplA domain-containing protein [Priestia]|jgi:transcriptional regulator of the spore photoproduct lyase operon|uniref:Transcriptional regulator n=3 Tax=Priestia TaxID=2800373 RepID=A0A0H4KHT9_9BACI|nr:MULTISPECIES: transcriptional regulator SplA domain-containing protein [Priestia]AKO91854.1 transcriptional regulator [Priestia filamentosa]KAB2490278.1 transcriptional regulator [Priestia endophytica]KYG30853.1 transcriptional regulator [Priestia endophytica]MBG9811409.1 transcriptional regulator [Priestia endophytica]MCM3537190.1 transcriptional regulator [Priestia endophytica]